MATQNSPANYSPVLRYKTLTSQLWTTTGNTMTVTDANVHSNSLIQVMNTSARNGSWYYTVSEGQFIITSSDSESATTTTFVYQVM
jgi:hypothetical protein